MSKNYKKVKYSEMSGYLQTKVINTLYMNIWFEDINFYKAKEAIEIVNPEVYIMDMYMNVYFTKKSLLNCIQKLK